MRDASIIAVLRDDLALFEAVVELLGGFVAWRGDHGEHSMAPENLRGQARLFLRTRDPIGYLDPETPSGLTCALCGNKPPFSAGGALLCQEGTDHYLCCDCVLALDSAGLARTGYTARPYSPGYHWKFHTRTEATREET